MRKLVGWGHWIVGACFIFLSASALWDMFASIPADLHNHPRDVTYSFISRAVGCAILASCAWGILKWRLWGHHLALFVSVVNLVIAIFFFAHRGREFSIALVGWALVAASITAWLLLPVVRGEYARRTLAA